jgi:hypothetical protein
MLQKLFAQESSTVYKGIFGKARAKLVVEHESWAFHHQSKTGSGPGMTGKWCPQLFEETHPWAFGQKLEDCANDLVEEQK